MPHIDAQFPGLVVKRLRRFGQAALDLAYPPTCVHCYAGIDVLRSPALCDRCRSLLAPPGGRQCLRCGANVADVDAGSPRCFHCRNARFHFDAAVALGAYQGELRQAVLRSKRLGGEPVAAALAEFLIGVRGDALAGFGIDAVAPVPMHWSRRLMRGANNAEQLANTLARRLACPAVRGAIVRRRNTKPQSGLPRRKRIANVRHAFGLRAGYDFSGAVVLIVDDILTTGATANEVAKVLRAAGAARVYTAVIARATVLV